MSLTDGGIQTTMPVAPAGAMNGGGFGGFGDGNGWWIILFFIVLMGWNRNGWGGNNGSGAVDNYVLASDFATLQRQIDSAASTLERKGEITQQGLCDGFYAMNTTLLNGFAGVNQNMNTGFQSAELSRCNQQAALMQQLNNMAMQAQECCCEHHPRHHRRHELRLPQHRPASDGAGAGGKGCQDRRAGPAALCCAACGKPERTDARSA